MGNFAEQFDAVVTELEDAGVDTDLLTRLRSTVEASPLRQEIKDLSDKLATVESERDAARGQVSKSVFKDVGIEMDPGLLRYPADLDITDPEKVRAWGIEAKLIEPKPSVSDEELAGQAEINNAAAGATGTAAGQLTAEMVSSWPTDKLLRLKESNPDAFEALKRGETVNGVAVG